MYLEELVSPIGNLSGVGKIAQDSYAKMGITSFKDLLFLAPRDYENREYIPSISCLKSDEGFITTRIKVHSHTYFGKNTIKDRILKIIVKDDNNIPLALLCFNRNFLSKKLYVGSSWYITAQVSINNGFYQTSTFNVYESAEEAGINKILPIYPLSGSLTQNRIRKDVRTLLNISHLSFDNDMPSFLYQKHNLFDYDKAIREFHYPSSMQNIKKARISLAFSEFFYMSLTLNTHKVLSKNKEIESSLEKKLKKILPFSLTEDQERAIKDIKSDFASNGVMNRLLQGDVGCGKTLVALLSALCIIEKNAQVAFMAPTELLARQHAQKIAELLCPLDIKIAFITSEVKGKERKLLLESLKQGEIDLAIGTHSLFSKDVEFKNLKYIIIDEQHRFGVEQRLALLKKGEKPHMLLMSATPIPRTLALTLYGDLAISSIYTMPSGRLPIITYTVKESNRSKMYESVGQVFKRGHQAYFVYPRIDDEGESNLRDVENMFTFLKKTYPGVSSALIHSKIPEDEKIRILNDFSENKISYLVSTSVVEVGIDIKKATCIVIEHAERFGLAALHQLRGRVGRSSLQSFCFLVYSEHLTEEGKARLRVMKESNDGFLIAEKDLEIRGPGDILGNKQSGYFRLNFGSITQDIDLLQLARDEAFDILNKDKAFLKPENHMIRKKMNLEFLYDTSLTI